MNFFRDILANPLSEHPLVTGISIAILVVIFGSTGFLLRRYVFRKKDKSEMPKSGIHASGNVSVDHGVIATDQSEINADVIGGDKNFVIQNNLYFAPSLVKKRIPKTETDTDSKNRNEVEQMMNRDSTPKNKQKLREIFSETEDAALKVQIALVLGPWFDPTEDIASELIEITSEAIVIARRSKDARPQLAALLSYKGMYYSFLFTHEYQEYNWKLAQRNLGKGLLEFYERELNFKDEQTQKYFCEAEVIADESGNYEAQAAVYLEIGQAAAHRAATFVVGDIQRRLKEKELVRSSLAKAEKAYRRVADQIPTSGELQIANVRHNFANNLLLLQGKDDLEEAKKMEQDVVEIAKKHGDSDLERKATWILKRLEGEPPPDYYHGETREI